MGDHGGAARLGVFGGTFDPIHRGHLVAAAEVRDGFGLDRVLFVPAGSPWQKQGFSAAEDRWMMTMLGIAGEPGFEASRIEIDRKGPTYTADTMAALRDFYGPGAALYFIAGVDAVITLGTWHGVDDLAATTEVIAVTRPGFDPATIAPRPEWPRVHLAATSPVEVSSTEIRARVRAGRSIEGLVPPEVERYIAEAGLYSSIARRPA